MGPKRPDQNHGQNPDSEALEAYFFSPFRLFIVFMGERDLLYLSYNCVSEIKMRDEASEEDQPGKEGRSTKDQELIGSGVQVF